MTTNLETLRILLSEFDGRAMTILGEISARLRTQEGYLDDLIHLAGDSDEGVSSGSTWLIKSWLEEEGKLTDEQTSALVSRLQEVREWSAVLHVCQSIRYLRVVGEDAAKLIAWLSPLLSHKRPFIRAWSLDAICHVSKSETRFADEAQHALRLAKDDPAGSVQARVRNIQLC